MEHHVRQRSQEWHNLRKGKVVTGSRFADAVGVGKGKPFDFLRSLIDDKIGVSPDAIVVDPVTRKPVGVCEFKAPMNSMYRDIPSQYMVQMHGQMAVTGLHWCDFMAVCRSKREMMLKRVNFCPQFWNFVANRLLQFCLAYEEFPSLGADTDSFTESKNTDAVKQWSVLSQLPFETKIQVTDLLNRSNIPGDFCGPSGHLMDFDLLMGLNV